MKLGIIFVLLITSSLSKAQTKTFFFFSKVDNKPLSEVLIYHRTNLIAQSNRDGKVTVQLTKFDSLTFIKNGYEDIEMAKNQLPDRIGMRKNQVITLNEVIVSPMNVEKLLKKMHDFVESKDKNETQKSIENYSLPANLQIYNNFMADNDTLHHLNNRLRYEGRGNFKINDQNKIIKKFFHFKNKDNLMEMYQWDGKKTNFWDIFTLAPLGIKFNQFSSLYRNQNLFDYKIVEDDIYYKIEFHQKKKFTFDSPSFEGYIIIDKSDFGIYEFESRLLNGNPSFLKTSNFSNNKPIKFKIFTDTYKFKYTKENDTYILNSSSRNTSFVEEIGEYKNIKFSCNIEMERTIDFTDSNLKKFNIFNWDIK